MLAKVLPLTTVWLSTSWVSPSFGSVANDDVPLYVGGRCVVPLGRERGGTGGLPAPVESRCPATGNRGAAIGEVHRAGCHRGA